MALAFDASSSTSGVGSGTSISWVHTCTGSDLILVVGINQMATYGLQAVTSATYNGVALTKIDSQDSADSKCRTELWYLIAPATGAHTVDVQFADSAESYAAGATSWTGTDQSTPLGTSAKATGTDNTITVNVSSAAGQFVLDSAAVWKATAVTATVGADQTERWNLTPLVGRGGVGSQEGGAATVTMSWGLSASASWATVAVPIKPGTGGGGAAETTASEIWVVPWRPEPLSLASLTGLLGRSLASLYPHLLAWKVVQGRFVWHDLGFVPAFAPLDAVALGDVPLGGGADPGLTLFGVESHDGVIITSLGSSALGASQRRYPTTGGAWATGLGVLYGSRMEFTEPHRLLRLRIWGEDFQQVDIVYFAYRWDRRRWYSVGGIHGLPATVTIQDEEGGMFLEYAFGFSDAYAWEPSLPVITRVDAEVEPLTDADARPEADVQVPEQE